MNLRITVFCVIYELCVLTDSDTVSAGSCESDDRFASVRRTTWMCTGVVLVSCCAVACCVCMLHTLIFGACMRVLHSCVRSGACVDVPYPEVFSIISFISGFSVAQCAWSCAHVFMPGRVQFGG